MGAGGIARNFGGLTMRIAKADEDQLEAVRSSYHSLIDAMKDSQYDIG